VNCGLSASASKDSRRFTQGFTLVEVMIVIAVTMIGFLAMSHLQAAVLRATENSWNAAGAVELAHHVQQTIRMEALAWTNDSLESDGGVLQTRFKYLKNVGAPGAGMDMEWTDALFYPSSAEFAMVNQLGYQPDYDAGVLAVIPGDRNQRYCVRYRLTWLVPNFLIRADVRVLWVREQGKAADYDACPAIMEAHPEDVFSIAFPTTVMRNVFVAQ
jgi:prepilin-type N-terminal cleavage/methylation domain-containing protein